MLIGPYDYKVKRIEGDYAILVRIDLELTDEKLVARALLPGNTVEGSRLYYEYLEYTITK